MKNLAREKIKIKKHTVGLYFFSFSCICNLWSFFYLTFFGTRNCLQLENSQVEKGYAEVIIGADEVAVAASPSGTAHAIVNIDPVRCTFLLGCQDSLVNKKNSTYFKVWKDL